MSRLLKGLYFWPVGFLVTTLLFLYCMARQLVVVLGREPRDGRPIHEIASLWGRSMFRLMPGWRVSVEGLEHLPPDGRPMVIVANHESMSDIWAMYYLGIQFRWLSKDEVFKLPMIGHAMRWARYVPVNRKSRESGAEAMRQSAALLRQGLSMFFFPEGTRSVDGKIKPFKLGAFKLAQDEQVPVLPIAIHGAGGLFPKGSALPGDHAHVRLRILPAVPPPSRELAALGDYAAQVRETLIEAHAAIS